MRSLALKAIPYEDGYKHQEGNSAAHVKASLMGCSQHVIIKEGQAYRCKCPGWGLTRQLL